MGCTTVSMDVYWNGIATPLFIFTLVMGMVTLFSMTPINRIGDSVKEAAKAAIVPLKAAGP
jgi:hypothetical protein